MTEYIHRSGKMINLINLTLSTTVLKIHTKGVRCCDGQFDMSTWLSYRYPTIQSNLNPGITLKVFLDLHLQEKLSSDKEGYPKKSRWS